MNTSQLEDFIDSEPSVEGEDARFAKILREHVAACGERRAQLRNVLVDYLRFSPQGESLINGLILDCIELNNPDRLDIAIDILSHLGPSLISYARGFLQRDVNKWNSLYSERAYEPDDDYWYILLRSLARAEGSEESKITIILACLRNSTRGIAEAVVEALGDMETAGSREELEKLTTHADPFIAELSQERLEG